MFFIHWQILYSLYYLSSPRSAVVNLCIKTRTKNFSIVLKLVTQQNLLESFYSVPPCPGWHTACQLKRWSSDCKLLQSLLSTKGNCGKRRGAVSHSDTLEMCTALYTCMRSTNWGTSRNLPSLCPWAHTRTSGVGSQHDLCSPSTAIAALWPLVLALAIVRER